MPHKTREARLKYAAEYHAVHRPSPSPVPQSRPGLPPLGTVRFSESGERVQCHVCGSWHRSLNGHVRAHGLSVAEYKEAYGLARSLSLLPPSQQARQRAAALARGFGESGREVLRSLPRPPQPAGPEVRLSSRIRSSEAKKGTYRGRKPLQSA
jgi:predicted transcriptional regulator